MELQAPGLDRGEFSQGCHVQLGRLCTAERKEGAFFQLAEAHGSYGRSCPSAHTQTR